MTSFEEFKLPPFVAKSLARMGFNTPTPIQQKAIGPALEGLVLLG